ncbi:MAG: DPP IV N-terminal domain-containing protein [Bacteroidota bacterium]
MKKRLLVLILLCLPFWVMSQKLRWVNDHTYLANEKGEIVQYTLPERTRTVVLGKNDFPSAVRNFSVSTDRSKILIFTNSKKVWRLDTRGEYWVFDTSTKKSKKLGSGLPASSLMFGKFSPDNSKVAYVSEYNVYVEDLATDKITN